MTMKPLTDDERAAIKALHRLAKRWPKTLWLYSAAASLHVMRCQDDGTPAMTIFDGVDPDFVVDTIKIPNDGGDW